ncbi:MAG: hypothetical protein LIP01_04105 [Tannerellaceae bacterium]|nr:hypothetical protein [Tannerellaceae bacterium]
MTLHETHLHKRNFTLLSNYDIYVQDSYYYKEKLIESNTLYRYDDEGIFYKVGTQTLANRKYFPEEKLLASPEKSALEETGDTYYNPVGTLGIGVATPKRHELTISVDKAFTHTIQIEDTYKQNFLRPLYNTIYYDIFHFVVDSEGEDYYKIWLNDQEKGYVKKDDFQFIPWEELICNALSLSPLTQKAFRNKNEHEAYVTVHTAKGIRTEGDWLQIKTFTEDNDYEATGETLWLKWRKNDKLMVEPYFIH